MKSLLPRQDDFKFLFACLAIEFVEIKLIPGYFVNVLIFIIIRNNRKLSAMKTHIL